MGYVEDKIEKLTSTFVQESEKTRIALEEGLRASLRGQRIAAALSKPVTPNAMNYGSGGRLVGWSLRAAGGPVVVNFRDGHDTAGDIVATQTLTDGQSATVPVMQSGASFVEGLFVEVTGLSGTVTLSGAVWIGAVD